jgi:hypothetical protein
LPKSKRPWKNLPQAQQQELLAFLAERVGRFSSAPGQVEDAFAQLIGAFAGPQEPTGRKTEEILYGKPA